MARRRPGDPASLTADMLRLAVDQLTGVMLAALGEIDGSAPGGLPRDTTGRFLLLDAQAALVNGLAALVMAERAE